jgi:hypothetical protein
MRSMCDRALEVGRQVAAVQLDLEADQAVAGDPLLERVGQAVAQRLLHVARLQGIAGADRVKHRQVGGGRVQVAVEVLAAEIGPR